MHTRQKSSDRPVATIGIDIGKTTFHLVGLDKRGAIVLRTKVSRGQLARRLANVERCLVGSKPVVAHITSPAKLRRSDMTCA